MFKCAFDVVLRGRGCYVVGLWSSGLVGCVADVRLVVNRWWLRCAVM